MTLIRIELKTTNHGYRIYIYIMTIYVTNMNYVGTVANKNVPVIYHGTQ